MSTNIRKWLIRGIGIATVTIGGYLIYQKVKTSRTANLIERVPDSVSSRLTKTSLLLLLDMANKQIQPKILKMTKEGRAKRKNIDPSTEKYAKMVKEHNARITKCIESSISQIIESLRVTESEFEHSVEHYRDESVRAKLFTLRQVRLPNPPKLSKMEISRILDYFGKVLQGLDEVSQIELLDLEIMFTQCEDKVFHKFGVEKADVEDQANQLAKSDKEIEEKLTVYRLQARQKEALFQGNHNLSHFHVG